MKLLLDQNISFRVAKRLKDIFEECLHISDCGLTDSEDMDIWSYAQSNGFTIVTFDSDFYDISLIDGHPPKIIWLRTGNLTKDDLVRLLTEKKDIIEEFIQSDAHSSSSCLEIE